MIHFTAKQFDFLCERFRCTFPLWKGQIKIIHLCALVCLCAFFQEGGN